MLHSLLVGLVAGMRSVTPLAAVALAAQRGAIVPEPGPVKKLADPRITAGVLMLAAGELLADKWSGAPDRIILPGLIARLATGAIAGAALAPRGQAVAGATVGAAGAVAAAYLTFSLRMAAMRRYGQVSTGLVEDAAALAAAALIVGSAHREKAEPAA